MHQYFAILKFKWSQNKMKYNARQASACKPAPARIRVTMPPATCKGVPEMPVECISPSEVMKAELLKPHHSLKSLLRPPKLANRLAFRSPKQIQTIWKIGKTRWPTKIVKNSRGRLRFRRQMLRRPSRRRGGRSWLKIIRRIETRSRNSSS